VSFPAVAADARSAEAAMQQDGEADDRRDPGDAAGDHGDELVLGRPHRPADRPVRRQEPDEMADDDDEDAIVEEVGAEAQPAPMQHLRGIALPGVGLAVEADEAAEQQDREGDIGIDAEEELVESGFEGHDAPSMTGFRPMRGFTAPSGPRKTLRPAAAPARRPAARPSRGRGPRPRRDAGGRPSRRARPFR